MGVEYYGDCEWLCLHENNYDVDVNIITDVFDWDRSSEKLNVFIDSNEPDFLLKTTAQHILDDADSFDLIVTRRPELLHLSNSVLIPYGTTFIPEEYREGLTKNKKSSVSYTMTNKFFEPASGYQLRFQILETWNKMEEKCDLPLFFYDSEKYPCRPDGLRLKGDLGRNTLMEHMFHIAVENCALENYFTEKLMDCLLTKTVPIYFGCPNISDYFDTDGMYIVKTCSELHDVLENLTEEDYNNKKEAMEKNYELALKYVDFPGRVSDEIKSAIKTKEEKE